jgi:competence protein ComEC
MTIIFSHLPQANLVLDFLSWRCPAPNWGVILGYYLPLIGLILVQQKTIRFGLILAFFSCIILLIASPFSSTSSSLRVTFLDVGQGQSILIEFPDQQKMLIDGGGLIGSQFDIGERVVSTFLWAKGIKTIDHLVLTHAHPDHLLGLFSVAENFRIKNFWSACSPQNEVPYQRFIRLLSPRVKRGRLSAGKELVIGEVKIQVISPDQTQINQTTQADNKTSLVLRLIYGQTSFLFPADITSIIERKLVAEKKNIQADILQVPHHGSLTSSCDEFLSSVSPIIAVASAGRHNPYHLPHPAVRQRYLQRGVVFLDTPQAGAVEITAKKNSLLVRTARTKEVYRIIYAWPPLIRAPQEK